MIKMKAQKCPICGAGSLKKEEKTQTFTYKGKSKEIPNYVTWTCSECGEAIVDNESLKASGKMLKDFQREVDGLLTGSQIKAIRNKLGLTQAQLANIIGGGLKSVARYESGQICQSKGMDNLLRILDAYPHTLNVIRKNDASLMSKSKITYIDEFKDKIGYEVKKADYYSNEEDMAYGT